MAYLIGSPSLTTGHSIPCILPLSQYPFGAHGRTSLYSCSWSVSISPLLQFVFCKPPTSHDSNSLKGLAPSVLRNKLILARQLGRAIQKRRLSGVLFCLEEPNILDAVYSNYIFCLCSVYL